MSTKNLWVIQILRKKDFECLLGNKNIDFIFYFPFILLLPKQGHTFEKNSGK